MADDPLAHMTRIDLHLDGDDCWPELRKDGFITVELAAVALLPDAEVTDVLTGVSRRVPGVVLRIHIPADDGGFIVGLAQVKLEMLESIVGALRGRMAFLGEQRAAGKGDA
jgi:hypothetical protein